MFARRRIKQNGGAGRTLTGIDAGVINFSFVYVYPGWQGELPPCFSSADVCRRRVGWRLKSFMEILKQLGGLFLAAAPTALFVFLFYLFLRWSFFGPIERVVRERGRRIEGARREAEELRKSAQEKNRAYQDGLRQARAELFREQEAARRAALDERAASLQQERHRANDEIQAAKKRIRQEIEAARAELERSSNQLAAEIARTILEPQQQMHPRPAGEV